MKPLVQFVLSCVTLLLPLVASAESTPAEWVRREVKLGDFIQLREYQGPNVSVAVRNIGSSIGIQIIDGDRILLSKKGGSYLGSYDYMEINPMEDSTIPKSGAVRVDARSEAFLLYDDEPTGTRVYWHDVIAPAGRVILLIQPGKLRVNQTRAAIVATLSQLTSLSEVAGLDGKGIQIAQRYQKVIYWLFRARAIGESPEAVLKDALQANGTDAARASLVVQMATESYNLAIAKGWLTESNLEQMLRGRPGSFRMSKKFRPTIEAEHIVPIAARPRYVNEFANLRLALSSRDEIASDRMDAAQEEHLKLLERLRDPATLPRPVRRPIAEAPSLSPDSEAPELVAKTLPAKTDERLPSTVPGWSLIRGTLLYRGKEISLDAAVEANRWGLPQKLFVRERVWLEKERLFGSAQAQEYAALRAQRLSNASERERQIVEKMRKIYLPAAP